MSRHSKWAKIKHAKGAEDVKRGMVFTKLARGITVAAREGGPNPEFNFRLRLAIDLARAANMPKDNIERAVTRAAGATEGAAIEEVIYEGFGPGGAAIIVECFTENKNRAASNLKNIFKKHGGNLAGAGAVRWMFERKGVVRIKEAEPASVAELELYFIDVGADDINLEERELVILTKPENLEVIKKAATDKSLKIEDAGVEWLAKEKIILDESVKKDLEALFEALDEDEDVNDYYTNAAES